MRKFECWRVEFDHFSYVPLVIVEEGTSLEMIETMALQVMDQVMSPTRTDHIRVVKIERGQEVYANV
jgi:hypothetical protein